MSKDCKDAEMSRTARFYVDKYATMLEDEGVLFNKEESDKALFVRMALKHGSEAKYCQGVQELEQELDIPPPEGKYNTLAIDPPWPIKKSQRKDYLQLKIDYPVMSLEDIEALDIPDLLHDTAHVYLWTTHKHLPNALSLFKTWNIKYHCLLTWVKPSGFTPFSWMFNTEHVLFGYVGKLRMKQQGLKIVFEAPVIRHSQKPELFYELVKQASPAPRLNMFARQERDGFVSWGNEV